MLALGFDTETSDLYNFKEEPGHPSQPGIVQLAAALYDNGKFISGFSFLVKPGVGYTTIAPKALETHKITPEYSQKNGLHLKSVMGAFHALVDRADVVFCHNYGFDSKMVKRSNFILQLENILELKRNLCTMTHPAVVDWCQLPGKYPGKYKWPKLSELHDKLFSVQFEDAHDAWWDLQATAKCFFELHKRGILVP